MGPRQKCLGNMMVLMVEVSPCLCCFNGAETKMSRKLLQMAEGERDFTSFNGAETKMSRKSDKKVTILKKFGVASMGPRQKCLGN